MYDKYTIYLIFNFFFICKVEHNIYKYMFKFTEAEDIYDDFDKEYRRHSKGAIILAPPGSGKTTFVNNQLGELKNWIDSDNLFGDKGLNIDWVGSHNEKLSYMRADYMLEQSKQYGYKIIGALFWKYVADAVVILPYEKHLEYYLSRKDLDRTKIKKIREVFLKHAEENNIPVFDNIEDAVKFLDNK